jgi:hypothetical protein
MWWRAGLDWRTTDPPRFGEVAVRSTDGGWAAPRAEPIAPSTPLRAAPLPVPRRI